MVNTEKNKIMTFGSGSKLKNLPQPEIMFFKGTSIESLTSYKYLGMTRDKQLNYSLHMSKVISVASGKLKQLQRMRDFLDTEAALMVYKGMLLPLLEYGDIFFTAASALNHKRLQTLQNKGLRCALNRGLDTSRDDLHVEAKLWKLAIGQSSICLISCLTGFRTGKGLSPPPPPTPTTSIQTRSHNKKLLKIKRPRTEKNQKELCLSWAQEIKDKIETKADLTERSIITGINN